VPLSVNIFESDFKVTKRNTVYNLSKEALVTDRLVSTVEYPIEVCIHSSTVSKSIESMEDTAVTEIFQLPWLLELLRLFFLPKPVFKVVWITSLGDVFYSSLLLHRHPIHWKLSKVLNQ
jgi:hypothetical protein